MQHHRLTSRNLKIDTARGLACLLLVAYHVIGSTPESGLRLADGPFRIGADLLAYIRMPLFTFLSGYVYGWRPFQNGTYAFITAKVRRLLIPMFVVGSLFVFVRAMTPGVNQTGFHWYLLHIFPVEHFWFVEALFIIFLLMVPLESFGLLKQRLSFAVVFAIIALIHCNQVEFPQNYFAINGTLYLLPFFLAGLAVSRFNLQAGKYYIFLLLGVILAYLYVGYRIQAHDWQLERRSLLALWIGVVSAFLIVRSGWVSKPLAWVGNFSYSIYLFHVFFTAATRIVLYQANIEPIFLRLIVATFAGIIGSILLDIFVSKYSLASALLFGKTLKSKVQASAHGMVAPLIDPISPQSHRISE